MATLVRSALEEAITSGLFLEYEARVGAHVVGDMQRTLLDLRQQLFRLEELVESRTASARGLNPPAPTLTSRSYGRCR
jgi:hypothetical protein